MRLRDEVKKRFSRGAIMLAVTISSKEAFQRLRVNMTAAKAYIDAVEALKKGLGAKGEPDIEFLIRQKDVLAYEAGNSASEDDWTILQAGVGKAFDQVIEWRQKEGEAISTGFYSFLDGIGGFLDVIEERYRAGADAHRERLKAEIERLVGERVDEARIVLEAAIFAERSDIAEEIARLKGHMEMFRSYLKTAEPVGKRLDFLCQEFFREINTIGSKSSDIEITRAVVEIKGVIEKMREQAQNVE
jgi:uncharacterized protein (TIGR00255 family)